MTKRYSKQNNAGNRPGYVGILGLLVVVVILLVLYFIQADAFFHPGPAERGQKSPFSERPWQREDMLADQSQIIPLPQPPKPQLKENVDLELPVSVDGLARGDVQISITQNGRVTAFWQGQYSQQERHYSYIAEFTGNIDAEKEYADSDGVDRSRLYFIAKGPYTKTITQPGGYQSSEQGTAYIEGFLGPDNTAHGRITITTDKSWTAVYEF